MTGLRGPTGFRGMTGDKGMTGPQGRTGPQPVILPSNGGIPYPELGSIADTTIVNVGRGRPFNLRGGCYEIRTSILAESLYVQVVNMSLGSQGLRVALYQQPNGAASEGVLWTKVGEVIYASPSTVGATNLVAPIAGGPILIREGYLYVLYGRTDQDPASAFSVASYDSPTAELLTTNVPNGLRASVGYTTVSSTVGPAPSPFDFGTPNFVPASDSMDNLLAVIRFV